jgi:CheY-like chemotaxis protein
MSKTQTADRILVVNDEEDRRKVISSVLTEAGYKCMTAADEGEALALLDSGEEFDLLLSSLMMPNLDGIGLLERTHKRFQICQL